MTIAKGLPAKVMNTADGGVDDAADQWVVEDFKEMSPEVAKADKDFSKVSYFHLLCCCFLLHCSGCNMLL